MSAATRRSVSFISMGSAESGKHSISAPSTSTASSTTRRRKSIGEGRLNIKYESVGSQGDRVPMTFNHFADQIKVQEKTAHTTGKKPPVQYRVLQQKADMLRLSTCQTNYDMGRGHHMTSSPRKPALSDFVLPMQFNPKAAAADVQAEVAAAADLHALLQHPFEDDDAMELPQPKIKVAQLKRSPQGKTAATGAAESSPSPPPVQKPAVEIETTGMLASRAAQLFPEGLTRFGLSSQYLARKRHSLAPLRKHSTFSTASAAAKTQLPVELPPGMGMGALNFKRRQSLAVRFAAAKEKFNKQSAHDVDSDSDED
eukprot:TRINITY_DN9030_c0_g1_i1.p2 TRINITY_DN9030_c0_g1~~TRINITY_DN9030_c0_g1_i1.p2  ORF type:complete len:313 (-),score=57.70 TRINITY_DN9030_c0_g1_i1:1706-2644(-)